MAKLIHSMAVSLDGYIADPSGAIDWTMPDEELHRFHNERVREQSAQLCGRGLYEVMLYWETVHEDPSASETELEFAEIWRALPKVVFSRTLTSVEGNWRLAGGDLAEEVAAIKEQYEGGVVGVGGAGLAAACIELDLIDEFWLFVAPVVLGGGTPFFPPLDRRIEMELVETRTFGGPRVVLLRYSRSQRSMAG